MRHVHVCNFFASLREADKICTTGNPRLIWDLARGRGRSTAALIDAQLHPDFSSLDPAPSSGQRPHSPTCHKQWNRRTRVVYGRVRRQTRRSRRAEDRRVREISGRAWTRQLLMMQHRYCVSTAAIKSMAANSHTKDSSTSLLRRRNHLCANRRRSPLRQLQSAGDYHRLFSM